MTLFNAGKKFPLKFHLILTDKDIEIYERRIKRNGGHVIHFASDCTITLTTEKLHLQSQNEAYDIRYIDDCIRQQTILNISDYSLNKEFLRGCAMCTFIFGTNKCKCVDLL